MATKTKAKAKRLRVVQQHFPGMEPVTIPEIEEAADAFFSAKEDKDDAVLILDNCKADLIAKMKKHEIRVYDRNGVRVEADTRDSVKVKKHQAPAKRDERRNPKATE